MRYQNTRTGIVTEIESPVRGGSWVLYPEKEKAAAKPSKEKGGAEEKPPKKKEGR